MATLVTSTQLAQKHSSSIRIETALKTHLVKYMLMFRHLVSLKELFSSLGF